jgi:hypothetical protein
MLRHQTGTHGRQPSSTRERTSGILLDALIESYKDSEIGRQESFLPLTELLQLITPVSVRQELERRDLFVDKRSKKTSRSEMGLGARLRTQASHAVLLRSENKLNNLSHHVCGEKPHRKLFAILIILGMPWKIKDLINASLSDADLPLDTCEVKETFYLCHRQSLKRGEYDQQKHPTFPRSRMRKAKAPHPPYIKVFQKWEESKRRDFYDKQWIVMAPYFDRGQDPNRPIVHHKLRSKTILPFLSYEFIGRGGFGEVFKVEIHSGHHNFNDSDVRYRSACPAPSRIRLHTNVAGFNRTKSPLTSPLNSYTLLRIAPSTGRDSRVKSRCSSYSAGRSIPTC